MRRQNFIGNMCMGAVALVGIAGTASADVIVQLGGGWECVLATTNVSITPLNAPTALTDGVVRVAKDATFTDIDPFTGAPMPISITFRQNAPDAQTVSQIIIDSEMIMNMTGLNWVAFRQVLTLSNNATFDNASLGMSVGPEFNTNTMLPGNREMVSSGGTGVANGGMWMPGATGGLVININLAAQSSPVVFTLKEIPVVPAPGAAALGLIGLAAAGRRRR